MLFLYMCLIYDKFVKKLGFFFRKVLNFLNVVLMNSFLADALRFREYPLVIK